jgi:YidC/Oxa1 family membrane protein insertase
VRFRSLILLVALALVCPQVRADIAVDTRSLQLQFSPYGDLVSLRACLPACGVEGAKSQLFSSFRSFVSLNRDTNSMFELRRHNGDHSIELIFRNLVSNEGRRWRIPHDGYLIGLEVSRPQGLVMASGDTFLPREAPGFANWLETLRYVRLEDGDVEQHGITEPVEPLDFAQGWLGYRNRFWAAMIQPDQPVLAHPQTGEGQPEARLDITPPHTPSMRYTLYAGPIEPGALKAADPGLPDLMYAGLWSWLGWLCHALYVLLAGIHRLVPSWALSIVVLSLIVQILMRPVNRYAERLQARVRATETRLAPPLRQIKQSYRGAEQAERIMELYRQQNVHPLYSLKSLTGMVFIIPVFIAAFNMLAENPWLAGVSFLWIEDLSRPDSVAHLPFSIPFLGSGLNLLPLLMTGLSVAAARLQNRGVADPQTRRQLDRRLWLMSLAFLLLFYTFPAGMVLYWTVNNAGSLARILHQSHRDG